MPLDTRGKIAAATIGFWGPIAIVSFGLTVRHAFKKDAGWFFLFWFALIRIVGGALILAMQLANPTAPSIRDLAISTHTLFSAGLALLFLSGVGFLGLAGQHQYSEYRQMTFYFRVVAILAIIAMGLSIAGEILGTHVNPNAHAGMILRRVAAGVYAGTYVLLILVAGKCWSYRYYMKRHRINLLTGVTFGLLALGVRVAYGLLDAWSAARQDGTELSSNPTLAQFNSVTGDYIFYLVMGLVMEFVAGAAFLLSSTLLMRRRRRY
ncbi:hypothetical protein Moror_291 [Moniliophthora roreri MCA 2997]|uniref:DUF7702 domain-containing protein n=2 Tax=Moniliophthora roreri TaxID=221103 RepID=V2Z2Q4_MONRO|nr:hypothetical protein Moror_291 [Moniliophthora roreri MCA 2997]KAI3621946.1 hypothetical protein WG66_015626 [Moniliophthora roreri]